MEHSRPSTALFDVYLRLRPSTSEQERFLNVEQSEHHATHVTIKPPTNDYRRRAVEKFAFTQVFEEHAGQRDILDNTGLVEVVTGVLGEPSREGRDGLLATLGVTGSGKSHTILGSKTQRGLTQLTLDLLFQHTEHYLANTGSSEAVFGSLCAAEFSEAQLIQAAHFLDHTYDNGTGRWSRATTPALVCDSQQTSSTLPGTFPSTRESTLLQQKNDTAVFDRLYPDLHKYQQGSQRNPRLATSPSKSSFNPISQLARMTRGIAKLTSTQDVSFLSAPSSKRYMPRVSALPQTPSVEDITFDVDPSAEYAIVVSMYEVYNDRIFDLLAATSSAKTLQKRRALLFKNTEASPDRKVVAGLRKIVCSSLEEALLVLETGLQERRVAGTGSNAVSSRSHGFFCIDVKKRHRGHDGHGVPGPWTSSTMTIVDLAGSERARNAKTAGATLAEAGKINESLMYLGQCMQMQSDNAHSTTPNLVPFRQCKLTELLFSNSFAYTGSHGNHKTAQKAIMIVTADPLGDFNATSQMLRYSALAREVTVPRIPSVTSTILAGTSAIMRATDGASGRASPSAMIEELEAALTQVALLREELEIAQLRLQEETHRRLEAEASWTATVENAAEREAEREAEIREEVCAEMEAKFTQEQRRWRAARDEEMDRNDEHLDAKMEILARGISIYEDEEGDKENAPLASSGKEEPVKDDGRVVELEDENARLKERLALAERERGLRSPSKKVRMLKSRKWDGSGMGLDCSP